MKPGTIKTRKPWGLYIHVPFCRGKCGYCDFYSVTDRSSIPEYVELLGHEMDFHQSESGPFDTIYVGGGTPSLLSTAQLEKILDTVHGKFTIDPNSEITLEVNPEGLSLDYLHDLHGLGINRLSIGLQSLDDEVLKFLGRRHSVEQGVSAMERAGKAGFSNISLDLIYCVPGQGVKAWEKVLREALDMSPEHLSLYTLTFEEKTPLGVKYKNGSIPWYDEEEQRQFFLRTAAMTAEAGYVQYEVSNFSRDDTLYSRHNSKYWCHDPYLGLGPGAHSFGNGRRWWNHRSVKGYLAALRAGNTPPGGSEVLDRDALRLESIYFGFRTRKGIDLPKFRERYGIDLAQAPHGLLDGLAARGWISLDRGLLAPTPEGMLLADALPLLWP